MNNSDKSILRELGKKIAEIAALPCQQETIRLWKALNGLKPERPMFMIEEIPWHEMDVDGELNLQCEDDFCRKVERTMRRTLYKWKHMRDDMVVEPFADIPKTITGMEFGIHSQEITLASDAANEIVSHSYDDLLETDEDLTKIRMPNAELDVDATLRDEAAAHEIFDGVLQVRMTGVGPLWFVPWDEIAQWRGVTNPLMDMVDRPDFLHRTMERLTAAHLTLLDQLETAGLLNASNNMVHSTGAWSDELPAEGFDKDRPRARDVWTVGMAQMLSSVSPKMHEEFEIAYAKKWYARFGLAYYGCCEPLDRKVDLVRKLPNVRKISMSAWANVDRGAEAIGRDYVFSRKPSPALVGMASFDVVAVEKTILDTLRSCLRFGCPVELILKDISTVCYAPERLWQWAQTARRLVEG